MPRKGLVNFIVLFPGRTGSSYLMDALNRHPEIYATGEILYDHTVSDSYETPPPLRRAFEAAHRVVRGCPVRRQAEITRHFFGDPPTEKRVRGFKAKPTDTFDLGRLKVVLEACEVRAIIMERRNVVKQAVSRLNSQRLHAQTSEWNLRDGRSNPGPFVVDEHKFDATLRHVLFDHRVLKAFSDYLDVPKMHVEYADLLADKAAWFGSTFRFLEVDPHPLESTVRKNTDSDLRSAITNFDALKARYAGTEFEAMFNA